MDLCFGIVVADWWLSLSLGVRCDVVGCGVGSLVVVVLLWYGFCIAVMCGGDIGGGRAADGKGGKGVCGGSCGCGCGAVRWL